MSSEKTKITAKAGGRGRRPWLCQRTRSSETGADGPQAEERAMAADAHRIAWVPCDEFLFFVFLAKALKKKQGLSGCGKKVPPNSEMFVSIGTVLFTIQYNFSCILDISGALAACSMVHSFVFF